MSKKYKCYFEQQEGEYLNIYEVDYMVRDYYLIEVVLENGLYIRQWKDLDCQLLNKEGETIDMTYGMLYLTNGNDLLDVRDEDIELDKWVESCESYLKS